MIRDIKELNFPSYATLDSAEVNLADMGESAITAAIKVDGEIMPDFSFDWEVEYRGEKYVHAARQPQASKDNKSFDSSVNLTFEHWAVRELKRWMFHTVQPVESGTAVADKYVASVSLNLGNFIILFGQVLEHYFAGAITISLNPNYKYKPEPTTVEISHSKIWEVVKMLYDVYKVHWRIEKSAAGYVIKVGYPETELTHIFEYGFEGGLMKVERQVQSADITNLLIGRGGEENIPYRYYKDTDPNNPSFKSDPDWVKELANIYFDRLRGATFRSYIQGWKAQHISEYPGYTAVGESNAYAPWAYRKGYTDATFDPVEYVGDKIADDPAAAGSDVVMSPNFSLRAVEGSSLDKNGAFLGGLDDNDDIFPTLQGITINPLGRIDQSVFVEQIESDEVEESESDTRVENQKSIKLTDIELPARKRQAVGYKASQRRHRFTVLEGEYANFSEGSKLIELWYEDTKYKLVAIDDSWELVSGSVTIHEEMNKGVFVEDISVSVINIDTGEEHAASGIPPGRWFPVITATIYNSTDTDYRVVVNCPKPTLMIGNVTETHANTFDVWIKNIWQTTKASNETDNQYVTRVWQPILGDKEGSEAKLVFSTGWLSTSEDYEFTIVKGGIHYDTSKTFDGVQSHWRLTLAKCDADLDATGLYVPSTMRQGNAGDYFFFTGIDMQHVPYVTEAEKKLDDWKKDNLIDTANIKPTWVVSTDRVRLNNEGKAGAIIDRITPGCVVTLRDKRFISGSHEETLYIQSVKITYRTPSKDDNALNPDVDLTLGNDYITNVNPVSQLQSDINTLREQVNGSISNVTGLIQSTGDKRYIRKDRSDRTAYRLAAGLGFQAGDYKAGESGAMVDGSGNAELLSAVVRQLLRSPRFASGLSGEGWKLWMEDGLASLELDRLTVRQIMTVFELIIDKIRAVGGQICVSAANGKIKTVTASQSQYYITFEQENSFVAGDLMRCQTFTNGHLKSYWAEVSAADGSGVWINTSEFVGQSLPEPGDECVLMGNTTDKKRQNLILISATEDGQPRMDVLDGVHDKNFADALRARLGNLDGISDSWFPLDNQPHGNGLYSDNAYLRGTFLLVTGEDIMTKFEIVEGKIQSMIEAVRDDLVGDGGYLANSDFKSGLSKWHYKASPSKLYQAGSSDKWLWLNGNTFANKGEVTSIVREGGRTVVRLRNSYIQQANADMRSHPTFTADENGVKHAVPVYLSFFYRCKTAGKLSVKFDGVGKTGFADFDSLEVYQNIAVTDDYVMFACEGLWNGTGDFIITFTGDICINLLTLSTDRAQALTYKYRTLFEQSEKLVRIAAQNFDQDGNVLAESGIFTTAMASGLYAIGPDGNIKSLVQAGQTGVKIKAENLELEGHLITANGNFKILEDGSIETKNGKFTGRISSESGKIGGFTISANSIISEGKYTTSDSSGVDMATSRFFLYSGGRGFMGFSDKYKTISLGLEPFPPGAIIGSCLMRCENETPSYGTYKNYGVFINVSGGYENIGLFMRGDIRANASGYHALNGNVVFDGNDEIRIAINMDQDGEYTKYYTGVTFAPEDYNLDRVRFRVCNGLIVGVSEEK